MFRRSLLAFALLSGLGAVAHATVWKRQRADGTVEFTNLPSSSRRAVPIGPGAEDSGRGRRGSQSSGQSSGIVWAREHDDGTMEFTNIAPVGARWKVLFRTGPGKAASMRGPSDLVPPRDVSPNRFARYDEHIRDQQAFYGIPQAFMRAIIKTESDFDPQVVSSAGAMGLMQLMPGTARAMGVTDVWSPRQNIMGGARYLQTLAKKFCKTPGSAVVGGLGGGLVCSLEEKALVLAAYHAGPGAVDKYGGLPPFETTRAYVTSVLQRYEEFRRREAALARLIGPETIGDGAAGPAVRDRM